MSKPADLTSKTWNKLKGLTVPSTGFGAKLDAYETARKKTEVLATRSLATFDEAAHALAAVTKHIPEAVKKCNKTLHKDTIETLNNYKPVIDKEGSELHSAFTKYQGYVDKYKHLREVCGKELKIIDKQMEAEAKNLIADIKKSISENNVKEAATKAKAGVIELQKIQKLADDSIAKPRVSPPAVEVPHADDRPDASVFTALIELQKGIIATRHNAENEIKSLIEDAVSKASNN